MAERPIINRSLDVFTHPAKPVTGFLHSRYQAKYRGRYRHAKKLFVLDIVLITCAIALAALAVVFGTAPAISPERVRVSFDTHGHLMRSGDRVTFTVRYENKERDAVGPVTIGTAFPPGFDIIDAPPGWHLSTKSIELGTLEPGARGELAFTGRLIVPVGSVQRFYATTRIGAEVRTTALSVKIKKSVIGATVTGPPRIIDAELATATINIKNMGTDELREVVVTVAAPPGAVVASSTPELIANAWTARALAPGVSAEFTLALLTKDAREGDVQIGFNVALRDHGALVRQGIAILTVKHVKTGLSVEANLDDALLRFDGKDRKFSITVTNRGSKSLRDAVLFLDLPSAKESEWTLGTLAPGGSATVATTIKLTEPVAADEPPFALTPVVSVEAGLDGESDRVRAVRPQKPLPIASDFRVNITPIYFTTTGEQLGRGPLPPSVGRATTFWIAVEFTHRGNEIKNLEFRGWIPLNVRWTDRHATTLPVGSSVIYDRETRRVIIKAPTLPVEGKWTTTFAVDIVPTRADIGKAPWLFLPETVSAHETGVNVPLDISLGTAVTTGEIVGR